MFLERLSVAGVGSNKYYASKGTFNKLSATSSSALPNCTTYCLLRSYEFLNLDDRIKGIAIRNSYGWHNAKYWFKETGMPTGNRLREGSIAVFDGNCGHVAFVERKIDETHALISESNYDENKNLRNWKYWRKREVELVVGKATLSGVGKLLGYIYLPIEDVDIRQERNINRDQVNVDTDMLNVRKTPGGNLFNGGCYCPPGIYDVLATSIVNDTTWHKIDEDCWIAQVDGVEFMAKESEWTVPEAVEEDPTRDQIYINNVIVRIRKEASTDSDKMGNCEKNVYYNVLEIAQKEDYTWYRIGNNAWVAGVEEVKFYMADQPEPIIERKINIKINNLRMREQPTTKSTNMGFATSGEHTYTETAVADGYTWYKIENGYWIAGIEGDVEEITEDVPDTWVRPNTVTKDRNKEQVFISDVEIPIRINADAEAAQKDICEKESYYDVLEVVNGTWYKIGDEAYIEKTDGIIYYPIKVWVKPTTAEEDEELDQIYLSAKMRIRYAPSTEAEQMSVTDKNVYYNVINFEIRSDYTWYQIGEDAWIAGVTEVEYRPKINWVAPVPVSGDINKNQLLVNDVILNIRLKPETSSKKKGTCIPNSIYDVISVKEQLDYTWYQLDANSWVAGVEEVDYIPAGIPKDLNAIIEDVDELKGTLDIAVKAVENKKCMSFYKDLQDKTNNLNDFIKTNFNYIDYDYEDDKDYNEIDLIYTTDIHGYWKGYEESTRVQTNFSINDLTTLKNNLKKQGIPSLLVNSGDIIHGSTTANANYGEDVVKAFNNVDMFASVFGNHEFRYNDEGPWFQTRMKVLESMTACNLFYKETGELVFKPYRIARFGSKVIGVIGVGFPGFDGGRGNTDEYTILDGLDCCKQIQKYIDELRELGANYIFCAVHLGDATDARAGGNISVPIIAQNTEGLSAILPGHTHAMTEQHTETNALGKPVIILAQPRCDLMYISRVRITKDGITSELLDSI